MWWVLTHESEAEGSLASTSTPCTCIGASCASIGCAASSASGVCTSCPVGCAGSIGRVGAARDICRATRLLTLFPRLFFALPDLVDYGIRYSAVLDLSVAFNQQVFDQSECARVRTRTCRKITYRATANVTLLLLPKLLSALPRRAPITQEMWLVHAILSYQRVRNCEQQEHLQHSSRTPLATSDS